MFATKQRLVLATAAAALLAFGGTAFAGDGYEGPAQGRGQAQVFAFSAPRLDTGSEAFPGTVGIGAGEAHGVTNHVTRGPVPAYQRGFDTGAEAYPTAP